MIGTEQRMRLAMIQNCPRDALLKAIAAHLYRAASIIQGPHAAGSPRYWYSIRMAK